MAAFGKFRFPFNWLMQLCVAHYSPLDGTDIALVNYVSDGLGNPKIIVWVNGH